MLKRTCPFSEPSTNQLKTHVGQKEVAHGVDGEKYMKEIHEKTLAMMYESQKELSHDETNQPAPTSSNTCGCTEIQLLPGQCLLDQYGHIIAGQTVPKKPPQAVGETTSPVRCSCCKTPVSEMINCYACNNQLCPSSSRLCTQCANTFCNMCSTINFDESYDRVFCLSCSSQMR